MKCHSKILEHIINQNVGSCECIFKYAWLLPFLPEIKTHTHSPRKHESTCNCFSSQSSGAVVTCSAFSEICRCIYLLIFKKWFMPGVTGTPEWDLWASKGKVNPWNKADSAEFWAKHFPLWNWLEFIPLKRCICSFLSLIRRASPLLPWRQAEGSEPSWWESIKTDWFIRAERGIWWVTEICIQALTSNYNSFCVVAVGLMSPIKEVNTQGFRSFFKHDWTLDLSLYFKFICVIISFLAHQILTCPPKLRSVSFSPRCITRQTTVFWLFPGVGFMSTVPLHLITSCLEASQERVKGLFCLSTFRGENVCMLWAALLPALLSSELGGDWIPCVSLPVILSENHWGRRRSTQVVCGWMRGWLLTPEVCEILSPPGNGYCRWNMSTVKAHKVLGDTSAFCRGIAEMLPWNHSTAPKKHWNQKVVLLLQERGGKSASRPVLLLIS